MDSSSRGTGRSRSSGGRPGLIGDPKESGERTLNPAELVEEWVARFRAQLERFYDFDSPDNAAVMVNNYDWTQGLSTLEFLRDVGKHFSVNRMLDREAVAARLAGNGISYTEFSYQLLQSYDYLQLHQAYGCTLQTGGSDQWGNIVAGVDLVRRVTGDRVHALTTPLVTKSDGTKFGKTESGTVWLDAELTSPYAWYQFWLNTEDAIVPSLLRIFSFRTHEEIEALEESLRERPQAREAQRALAEELTDLVHGPRRARPGRGCRPGTLRPGRGGRPRPRHARRRARRGAARGRHGGGVGRGPHGRRRARAQRAGGLQGRGPAHHRRGRGVRLQRPRHRARTPSSPTPTCSTGAGSCCGVVGVTSAVSGSRAPETRVRRRSSAARRTAENRLSLQAFSASVSCTAPRAGMPDLTLRCRRRLMFTTSARQGGTDTGTIRWPVPGPDSQPKRAGPTRVRGPFGSARSGGLRSRDGQHDTAPDLTELHRTR